MASKFVYHSSHHSLVLIVIFVGACIMSCELWLSETWNLKVQIIFSFHVKGTVYLSNLQFFAFQYYCSEVLIQTYTTLMGKQHWILQTL